MLTYVLKVDYYGLIFYKSIKFDPLDQSLWTEMVEGLNNETAINNYPKAASKDLSRWLRLFHAYYYIWYEDFCLENLDYGSFIRVFPSTKYGEELCARHPSDIENKPALTKKKKMAKYLLSVLSNPEEFDKFVSREFFGQPNSYENRKHISAIFDASGNHMLGRLKFAMEPSSDSW